MRRGVQSLLAPILALILLVLTGCSSAEKVTSPSSSSTSASFATGSSMAALAASQTVRIGVKTDQPGLGYLEPGADVPIGFDIEIAKIIAGALGIPESKIQWVPVSSVNREALLKNGSVDLIVASFSITDERRTDVGQAGPYFLTGQQIMVSSDETDIAEATDLAGKTVCQVAGSHSAEVLVDEYDAIPKAYSSYSLCVDAMRDGELDAVSTDGAILQGFAGLYPDDVTIVGAPFTTERYGIGYRFGDHAMCEFLSQTLLDAYADGSWEVAFESTIGEVGLEAPVAPRPDDCPAKLPK